MRKQCQMNTLLYKSLSKNSYSVDLSDIKNTSLKHYQILSKIPTKSTAQNLFHSQFHFLGFFLYIRNTYLQENRDFLLLVSFQLQCVKQELSLFVSLFLQKIRYLVLVSYKLGTLQLIFKTYTHIKIKV